MGIEFILQWIDQGVLTWHSSAHLVLNPWPPQKPQKLIFLEISETAS